MQQVTDCLYLGNLDSRVNKRVLWQLCIQVLQLPGQGSKPCTPFPPPGSPFPAPGYSDDFCQPRASTFSFTASGSTEHLGVYEVVLCSHLS